MNLREFFKWLKAHGYAVASVDNDEGGATPVVGSMLDTLVSDFEREAATSKPVDLKIVKLVEYIVGHSERESRLLTPDPQHFIGSKGLLDAIVDIFEMSKDDMGRIVDEIADRLEAADKAKKP